MISIEPKFGLEGNALVPMDEEEEGEEVDVFFFYRIALNVLIQFSCSFDLMAVEGVY